MPDNFDELAALKAQLATLELNLAVETSDAIDELVAQIKQIQNEIELSQLRSDFECVMKQLAELGLRTTYSLLVQCLISATKHMSPTTRRACLRSLLTSVIALGVTEAIDLLQAALDSIGHDAEPEHNHPAQQVNPNPRAGSSFRMRR